MPLIRRLLTALCLAGAPAGVSAQQPGQILRIDTNRDGVISLEEFNRARRADFERLDRNRDGRLSRQEFIGREKSSPALSRRRAARFRAMDRNGDGMISRQEYLAFGRTLFNRLDRDGDRRVTQLELRRRGAAPPRPRRTASGTAPPPPGLGARRGRSSAARSQFGAIDGNGDGFITRKELRRARQVAFERLDADRNGKLTAAEVVIIRGRGSTRRFLQMDTNRDGVVSRQEFQAAGERLLAAADTNGDGRISFEEFRRVAAAR